MTLIVSKLSMSFDRYYHSENLSRNKYDFY